MPVAESKLEDRRRDYEVFDTLPPKVREALRNGWENLNARVVAHEGRTEEGMLQVIWACEQEDIDAWWWKIENTLQSSS